MFVVGNLFKVNLFVENYKVGFFFTTNVLQHF